MQRYEFRYKGPNSHKFTYLTREFNFLLLKGITATISKLLANYSKRGTKKYDN